LREVYSEGHWRLQSWTHTLWPKVKRLSISTKQIARNQEFDFSTFHTRGQSPKVVILSGNTFWPKRETLEGSVGRIGMEPQTMVERPIEFFYKKIRKNWQDIDC
jgi:hypothetical protein